jgi:hypothetical protein
MCELNELNTHPFELNLSHSLLPYFCRRDALKSLKAVLGTVLPVRQSFFDSLSALDSLELKGALLIDLSIIARIPSEFISTSSFGDIDIRVLVNRFEVIASFGSSAFTLDLPITLPGGSGTIINFGLTDSTFSMDFFVRNAHTIDILELFSGNQESASLNLEYGGTLDAYLPLTVGIADVNIDIELMVHDSNLFEANPVVDYAIDLCDVTASMMELFEQLKAQIVSVIEAPFGDLAVTVNIDKITDPLVQKVDNALSNFTSGMNVAMSAENCGRRLQETATSNLPPGFSFVGKGYCLDSHKRLYSYLGEVFAPNISDTECLSWCSQVPHPDLVGGEIDRRLSYTLCNCNFGGGRIPSDVAYADYNPDATHNETEPGVGEIRSSQGDPIEVCYVSTFS